MSDLSIWHNPRCSKSRETLKLLRDNGHAPEVVQYLVNPPNEADIRAALASLGVAAIAMMRPKEKAFAEMGLIRDDPEDRLIKAMCANPILIERPIVFKGPKAAIGRPPEAVLDIL